MSLSRMTGVGVLLVLLLLLSPGAFAYQSGPIIIDGVLVEGGVPHDPVAPVPYQLPARAATWIRCDDLTAPCLFGETNALREEYAALGVHFTGPAPLDGGGVLNECGAFGVTGYSSPNFLAFYRTATFASGGLAAPPETIAFDTPIAYFEAKVGSNSSAGSTVTLTGYSTGGAVVATGSAVLAPEMQTVVITATDMLTVVVDTPAQVFVLDDVAFAGAPAAATVSALGARQPSSALAPVGAGLVLLLVVTAVVLVWRRRR